MRRCFPVKKKAGLFKFPNRECLFSYFARHLFCQCNISHNPPPSLCMGKSWGGGHCPRPSNNETGKSLFFSQHWLDRWHLQPCTVKSLFSQCLHHPCRNLGKNVFVLVWQTRYVTLCVNVYILLYMCVTGFVWMVKMGCYFFVCVCSCFFSACYFECERLAVRYMQHFFKIRLFAFSFLSFTHLLMNTFLSSALYGSHSYHCKQTHINTCPRKGNTERNKLPDFNVNLIFMLDHFKASYFSFNLLYSTSVAL